MEDISIILWDQNWAVWPQDQMLCLLKTLGNGCCMHSFSNLSGRSLNLLQRSLRCLVRLVHKSPSCTVTQFLRIVCSTHFDAIFLPPVNYGFYCTPRYIQGKCIHPLTCEKLLEVFFCLHAIVFWPGHWFIISNWTFQIQVYLYLILYF